MLLRSGPVLSMFGLLLTGLLLSLAVAGSEPGAVTGMRNMHFRTYSVLQGLPQASAVAMAQDDSGFVWVATQDGLVRFDSYDFKVFKHDRRDPQSLSDSYVRAMVPDGRGGLWIGARSGDLNRYNPWAGQFEHWPIHHQNGQAARSSGIAAMTMAATGRLWIVSGDGVLQWLDPGGGRVQRAPLGYQDALEEVRVLLAMNDGTVLVGSRRGLFRLNPDGSALNRLGPTSLDVYAIASQPEGPVWVGTAHDGLYRIDVDGKVSAHFLHVPKNRNSGLPDNEIRALMLDRRGTLWIACNSSGLASLNPATGTFQHYRHRPSDPYSVAANRLSSLLESRSGLLLVGSWTNGFSIHDPATENFLQIYSVPGDHRTLPAPPALSVFGDADGSLWAGIIAGGGLVHIRFDAGVVRRYAHDPDDPNSLSNNFVHDIVRARGGGLWVATDGGGLDRLRPNGLGFDHLRHDPSDPHSLASDAVLSVLEDSKGTLWVATRDQGLDERCATCSGFRHHQHEPRNPDSLASNAVSKMLEAPDGGLWVATRDGGLDRLDRNTGKFSHCTSGGPHDCGLSANSLTALFLDRHGMLWVGTQGGALNRQIATNKGTTRFAVIDQDNGLDSDSIGGILDDSSGHIWVSTLKGISRIDPASSTVINYTGHTGAGQRGYWVNSATNLSDGRLAFGGLDGITVFRPVRLPEPVQPEPIVTGMQIGGQPYQHELSTVESQASVTGSNKSLITLRHDQNDVSFEISALQYADPESVAYAYRLEGYSSKWTEVSWRRRIATYTGLPAGAYTLHLRARGSLDRWSQDTVALGFRILAPPWRTTQAYALYLLAVLCLAALAAWRTRSNLQQRHRTQEAIRLSEARLKMALWGSGTELWDVDLREGRVYRDNRLAHLALGAEAEGRIAHGQTLAGYPEFLHPQDRKDFERALFNHLTGKAASFEASYRTLDRHQRWVWVLSRGQVVQRDRDGRALRISGTTSDINALKQAEEALRKLNQELEDRVEHRTRQLHARNTELHAALEDLTQTQRKLLDAEKLAALGGLVAGVAHEINTPLGVALTAASYLHEEARGMLRAVEGDHCQVQDIQRFSRKADKGADIIVRNLQKAGRLVGSFKQVAVAQSSEDVREVDLRECLDDVLVTLGPLLKKSPHRLELSCAHKLSVRLPPGALYQIITNLVVNAMTHAFDEGQAGVIQVRARLLADEVRLHVVDDGHGMSEEICRHVFEPFFTTRRGQGGSGLGLHIVYNLVSQVLKGSIEVHSRPGQGSEFVIHFPARMA